MFYSVFKRLFASRWHLHDDRYYTEAEVDNALADKSDAIIGEIRMFAGPEPMPAGWLICNGQEISRTTYADLFNLIGTTYGNGDDATTFNVPDLVSKFPLGASNVGGVGTGIGNTGGESEHTLTQDEMPAHDHAWTTPGGGVASNVVWSSVAGSATGARISGGDSSGDFAESGPLVRTRGGGQPHNNMPPYLAIYFIIYAGA